MPHAPAPSVWRLAGTGAALAAYALVSHLLMVHAPDRAWSVAALFGPLWAAVALGAWLRRHWPTLAACAAVFVVLAAVVARGGAGDIHLMYVLQHAGLHAALAWAFTVTLRPGQVPLITALAVRVHLTVTPAMRDYTRRLTQAWVAYFIAMIGFSLALYMLAPWAWWSLFCNVATPLAALAFFAAEHGWRRLRHPEFERVSPMRVWQAWRQWQPGATSR
ncbi:MAG: hypothetical protein HZC37_19220 [Burkholderiales bacterium]|nr:hypothetical protein [Burkholderiales bacterium]